MAWKPDSIEADGLWGDQQGPHPEPLDAGLYKPSYAYRDPDWYHRPTYNKTGEKKNQWHRQNDQEWALNPYITDKGEERGGQWIQVDRMMKPLLEELWKRGHKTKFSDQGGDYNFSDDYKTTYPNWLHRDEIEEKSVFGSRGVHETGPGSGYLYFDEETGIPEEYMDLPLESEAGYKRYLGPDHEMSVNSPTIDDEGHSAKDAPNTIRWEPRGNMDHLRQLYDRMGVPFPEQHMKDGMYQWR